MLLTIIAIAIILIATYFIAFGLVQDGLASLIFTILVFAVILAIIIIPTFRVHNQPFDQFGQAVYIFNDVTNEIYYPNSIHYKSPFESTTTIPNYKLDFWGREYLQFNYYYDNYHVGVYFNHFAIKPIPFNNDFHHNLTSMHQAFYDIIQPSIPNLNAFNMIDTYNNHGKYESIIRANIESNPEITHFLNTYFTIDAKSKQTYLTVGYALDDNLEIQDTHYKS